MGCAFLVPETIHPKTKAIRRRYTWCDSEYSYWTSWSKDLPFDSHHPHPLWWWSNTTDQLPKGWLVHALIGEFAQTKCEECSGLTFTNCLSGTANICSTQGRRLFGCILTAPCDSIRVPSHHQWDLTHSREIQSKDPIHCPASGCYYIEFPWAEPSLGRISSHRIYCPIRICVCGSSPIPIPPSQWTYSGTRSRCCTKQGFTPEPLIRCGHHGCTTGRYSRVLPCTSGRPFQPSICLQRLGADIPPYSYEYFCYFSHAFPAPQPPLFQKDRACHLRRSCSFSLFPTYPG